VPEIKKEDAKVMEMAMKGLFFESVLLKIKASSLQVLDQHCNVMTRIKAYNLNDRKVIADASGDEAKDLILSKEPEQKQRKNYLY